MSITNGPGFCFGEACRAVFGGEGKDVAGRRREAVGERVAAFEEGCERGVRHPDGGIRSAGLGGRRYGLGVMRWREVLGSVSGRGDSP